MLVVVFHFHFWSSFVDVFHFVVVSSFTFHLLFGIIPHPSVDYRWVFTAILYFQPSPSLSVLRYFSFSVIFLPRALPVLSGHFSPTGIFFTLRSFTDILTCIYQGFPRSRQFFLEVCRASYWSSKYRPGPSVCLIHSNPQTSYSERFSFKFYHILAWITCDEKFSSL